MFLPYAKLLKCVFGFPELLRFPTHLEPRVVMAIHQSISLLTQPEAEVLKRSYGILHPRQWSRTIQRAVGLCSPYAVVDYKAKAEKKLREGTAGYRVRQVLAHAGYWSMPDLGESPGYIAGLIESVKVGIVLTDEELLAVPVRSLGLTVRANNMLRRGNYETLLHLNGVSRAKLQQTYQCGKKTLAEVEAAILPFGIVLTK